MKKIREIIEKYAWDTKPYWNANSSIPAKIIDESDFDKLEKELDDYVGIVLETVYDRIRKVGVEKMNEIWNKK